jgi:hypothetical protein
MRVQPTVRRLLGAVSLSAVCLLAFAVTSAQAATHSLFAAPTSLGSGDCSSSADACSIAIAVEGANAAPTADSVVIELAGGTYTLNAPSPTALEITFAGPSLALKADGGVPVLDGTGTVRVLSVATTSNVTVEGLVIKGGSTTGLGGGIENKGVLTVEESTFSENSAANGGAIVNTSGATLTVEDSMFSNNTTTGVGGGAVIDSGTATVERSLMISNEAPINGGAINVQPGGSMTVAASTIAGNTSGGQGGGLSNLGKIDVETSTLVENSSGAEGSAFATGNTEAMFAADIIGPQASEKACAPNGAAIVDGGYNLETDGTCISGTSPATGSHNGTTALGSSTYGAVLTSYLAGAVAANGGPTATLALLNTASPPTELADPAFDVVPPSFELPAPVDGVSQACSLADQRGIVPVAGANCAIGAYLLQATMTKIVTSAPQVTQGEAVTYTALITPAAEGGTVTFDGGPGSPATTQCAAQSVTDGRATCTVTYPNTGSYSVSGAYSGDGTMNNFAPSASEAPAATTVVPPAPTVAPSPAAPKVKLKVTYSPNHPHQPNRAGGPRYTFRFTAQGQGLNFYCRLDKGGFKPCGSPKVYPNLKPGRHVFKVKARDVSGAYSPVRTVKFIAGRR